jgi:uncharacterized protein
VNGALPRRLRRLAPVELAELPNVDVRVAGDPLARLLGLAGLRTLAPGCALLLSSTRSIHTCGMRFALDLVWLDRDGRVVRTDRGVRPWRVRLCRAASQVVEVRSPIDP